MISELLHVTKLLFTPLTSRAPFSDDPEKEEVTYLGFPGATHWKLKP